MSRGRVPNPKERRALRRRTRIAACACGLGCAAALLAASPSPDQPAGDAVGVIDGADIAVTGPMSVEMVGGQVKTVLRSGSDVRVKSGQARINLVESGQISICGPAHFSVLKSGGGLTLALESGIVHMRLDRTPAVTVYTAQIQAQPVGIGDDPRDFLVGFASPGAMCIRTYRGAMRLEQQLSGQNVMVPQGGDVLLANGQLDALQNGSGHCSCEFEMAKARPVPPAPASSVSTTSGPVNDGGVSVVAQDSSPRPPVPREPPAAKDVPVYQVSLPPLRYDATANVQPAPDPRLMVIVRRVRVRPTLIFQGRVESETVVAAVVAPPSPPPVASAPTAPPAQVSVMDRVWSFFKRMWTRGR